MTDDLLPGYFVEEATGAWLTLEPFPVGKIPTIGYDVVNWCEIRLHNAVTGDPWRFTRGQLNFLLWWYALRGKGPAPHWMWRRGVKRGAKGTGKDPMLAALALCELVGPARPAWIRGEWHGVSHSRALVQIGANSEGQARDPLWVANGMVDAELSDEYGFDKGILRTQVHSGSRIEVLTNSEASTEGDPATAIFLNESHHMQDANGGKRLAKVARRNVAKSPGGLARVLEFTNTHMPGEDSVAENSYEAWQLQVSGDTRVRDILYDSREAPPGLSIFEEADLMRGLTAAYADAPWEDLERLRDEVWDPDTSVDEGVRYFFSSLPTSEDAWIDPRKFDDLAHPTEVIPDAEPISMFLTCSRNQDGSALVACRISDGHVFLIDAWESPKGQKDWACSREDVDAAVMAAKDRYDVQWFGVDASRHRDESTGDPYWADYVDKWHRDFRDKLNGVLLWTKPGEKGNAISFDLREMQNKIGGRERLREFTQVAEQTVESIEEDLVGDDPVPLLTWDGDSRLRLHTHNARRRSNRYGISLGKKTRDSNKLVDCAVAMVGARLGRRRIVQSGKVRKKRTGRAMSV